MSYGIVVIGGQALRAVALGVANEPASPNKPIVWRLASMTRPQSRRLKRHFVGGLPLLHRLAERIGLKALFSRYVPAHGNDQVPVVDTLMLLVYNLILGKDPLYELQAWVDAIEPRTIGYVPWRRSSSATTDLGALWTGSIGLIGPH